jgi:hypothetical protein
MPQDPLQAILLQQEIAKKSWANPANRPPRDTSALINRRHEAPAEANLMQRIAIEDLLGVFQPQSNVDPDRGYGLPMNPKTGALQVITDPKALMRDVEEHPELYQPENDDPDEDAADNTDQDPNETLLRLFLSRKMQQ